MKACQTCVAQLGCMGGVDVSIHVRCHKCHAVQKFYMVPRIIKDTRCTSRLVYGVCSYCNNTRIPICGKGSIAARRKYEARS